MALTAVEMKLAAVLLREASDHYANHGCNDFSPKEHGLSEQEVKELDARMAKWNGDEGDDGPGLSGYDSALMGYLASRLREETKEA